MSVRTEPMELWDFVDGFMVDIVDWDDAVNDYSVEDVFVAKSIFQI